jgi:hypothetical protein
MDHFPRTEESGNSGANFSDFLRRRLGNEYALILRSSGDRSNDQVHHPHRTEAVLGLMLRSAEFTDGVENESVLISGHNLLGNFPRGSQPHHRTRTTAFND